MSVVGRGQTTVNEEDHLTELAQLCTLDEPTRRSVYQAVRRSPPASRAQVADVVGISVSLAAFHLDTLVDAGLLRASYARPPGRGGPGAGRPAKWYRPSDVAIEVSAPPRRYDVLGAILADAAHRGSYRRCRHGGDRRSPRRRLAPGGRRAPTAPWTTGMVPCARWLIPYRGVFLYPLSAVRGATISPHRGMDGKPVSCAIAAQGSGRI